MGGNRPTKKFPKKLDENCPKQKLPENQGSKMSQVEIAYLNYGHKFSYAKIPIELKPKVVIGKNCMLNY